ncbi:hypothetical protein O0I10_004802 [Lichtheimia ornata]|uniref:PQ-loop-domain-containing protein n=1 Tax=Lichtheimia ornata TaxID=688661 RepID=A0AAD7Y1Y5_9FUNG|nr:uncharacterized protein O0I10_004802 [Lichtheimia ornata]KAJ8659437.1 hypothetical protein O0I10_004802 [Lichtheimia ornata]
MAANNTYIVEQVFGYLGLVMWSFQLVPQIYKSYRRKTTEGVSPWAMLIWALSGVFLGNYNIGVQVAVPLIVQPQLFSFFAYVCLAQELYYRYLWNRWRSTAAFIFLCLASSGLEIGLVFGYWAADHHHNKQVIDFFGLLPVVAILVGFIPQYWSIARERRVEGISHVFLGMDCLGSVFSCISLAFRSEIDALTLVNYLSIAVLDLGIIFLYYVFKWWNNRKAQRQPSLTIQQQQQPQDETTTTTTLAQDDIAEKGLSPPTSGGNN